MRRGPSSLFVATGLHAVLLLGIAATPRRHARVARRVEPKDVEIDLDLVATSESSALAGPLPEAPEPQRENAPNHRVGAIPVRVASRSVQAREEPTESTTGPLEPQAVPPSDGRAELPPGYRVSPVGLSGGGQAPNPFLASPAYDALPEEKAAERAIRSSLLEHDRRLGLGASGPVVAALEDVARTSIAAVESHAVIEVVADGEGNVISATVSDAREDRGGWEAVAKGLLAALRTKRLHVAHGSRGVAITIAIESRETLPSGASPGVNVTVFDQKVAHGKNDRSAKVSIFPLARIPVEVPVPGRPGATETKTIVLPVPMPTIGGVFDVSDLAAPAARVVHAHTTSEREL